MSKSVNGRKDGRTHGRRLDWYTIRPNQKIPVFLLTLAQTPDPAFFIAIGKKYSALAYQIFHPILIIFRFAFFCYQKICRVIYNS